MHSHLVKNPPSLTDGTPPTQVPAGPITPNSELPKMGVRFDHPAAAHLVIEDHHAARVKTDRTKVALVGFAMSSALAAPWDDPSYEIWGMNQLYRHIPRADRWFEIHENWHEHVVEGTDHEGWMKAFPGPIYTTRKIEGIPNSVPFPRMDCAMIGADYFTSTIAFMLALALRDGFQTVELYGIDLVCDEEWDYQKPCAEFWIGLCHGKGMTVGTHRNSALLKQSHCYGYEQEPKSLILLSELEKRRAWLQQEKIKRVVELNNIDGALADVEMWLELATLRKHHATVAYEPPKTT